MNESMPEWFDPLKDEKQPQQEQEYQHQEQGQQDNQLLVPIILGGVGLAALLLSGKGQPIAFTGAQAVCENDGSGRIRVSLEWKSTTKDTTYDLLIQRPGHTDLVTYETNIKGTSWSGLFVGEVSGKVFGFQIIGNQSKMASRGGTVTFPTCVPGGGGQPIVSGLDGSFY